jgi:hypothetical protein
MTGKERMDLFKRSFLPKSSWEEFKRVVSRHTDFFERNYAISEMRKRHWKKNPGLKQQTELAWRMRDLDWHWPTPQSALAATNAEQELKAHLETI